MKEIKPLQIGAFYLAFMPVIKYFTAFSYVAHESRDDFWLSILLAFIIDFIFLSAFYFLYGDIDVPFYELMESRLGKARVKILFFLFTVLFFIKAFLPIAEQKNFIESSLYESITNYNIFMVFFVAAFFICMANYKSIGRCGELLFLFTVFGSLLIFALSFSNTDFTAILPFGTTGVRHIVKGAFIFNNWGGDAVYMLFFLGRFKKEDKAFLKISLFYTVGALLTVFGAIIFYGTFQSLAEAEYYHLTEVSKFSNVVSTTARFDYIGVFMIIFNGMFSLSMPLFLATYTLRKVFNFKRKYIPAAIITILMLITVYATEQVLEYIKPFIVRFSAIAYVFVLYIVPLLLLLSIKVIRPIKRKIYENF